MGFNLSAKRLQCRDLFRERQIQILRARKRRFYRLKRCIRINTCGKSVRRQLFLPRAELCKKRKLIPFTSLKRCGALDKG